MIKKLPTDLKNLNPADFNPRIMSDAAREGLHESIEKFGDLSGLVYNFETTNMIAGHQRREELLKLDAGRIVWSDEFTTKHGTERMGQTKLPDGSIFTVRGVHWPIEKEKAANIAANNPLIAGEFTPGLASILADIEGTEFGKGLRFEELPAFLPKIFSKPDEGGDDEGDEPDDSPKGGGVKLTSLFYDDEDMELFQQLVMKAKVTFAASTPSAAVLEALKKLDEMGELVDPEPEDD